MIRMNIERRLELDETVNLVVTLCIAYDYYHFPSDGRVVADSFSVSKNYYKKAKRIHHD